MGLKLVCQAHPVLTWYPVSGASWDSHSLTTVFLNYPPPSMSLLCCTNAACHLLKVCVTAQTLTPAFTRVTAAQHSKSSRHPVPQSQLEGQWQQAPSGSQTCFLLLLCNLGILRWEGGRRRGKKEGWGGGGGGGELTRKKTKTKRRSHWKMGESTYWYQLSLEQFPVWLPQRSSGIFVRAGFLYSPL